MEKQKTLLLKVLLPLVFITFLIDCKPSDSIISAIESTAKTGFEKIGGRDDGMLIYRKELPNDVGKPLVSQIKGVIDKKLNILPNENIPIGKSDYAGNLFESYGWETTKAKVTMYAQYKKSTVVFEITVLNK